MGVGTEEQVTLALTYLQADECEAAFRREDLPGEHWPLPTDPMFPFSGGLVDYLRPVGPGVYVGVGWKRASGWRGARQFLHFLLVREPH
jgi:hypothetical protein